MKKVFKIWTLALLVIFVACTDNPLEDIEGTSWQKERNIVSILLEGQIGTAVITRNFDDAKINIYAKYENIADISKVAIKNLELSYGATTPNAVGTTLDFSSGSAILVVASGAGETLNWEVTLNSFKSDLEGTWFIGDIRMYCDMFTWESWGWEKNESIFGYLPELNPELDNTITFTVEGADANGNPFGNFEHNAGNDNAYGNFGDTSKGWDFNERFRKMPKNTGTWLRDFERNKLIITDENNQEHEFDLEILTDTNEVKIEAALPYLAELFNWTGTDWAYEELAHMSNPMWYVLTQEKVVQTGNDITGLGVASQVGDAVIDTANKTVTVVIEDNGADTAAIEITALSLSYAATADKNVGNTLDFSNNYATQITVISEAGEAVIWTINLQIDIDVSDVSIAGTWVIEEIGVYSDLFTWESWGWDKSELLNNYLPSAAAELDNTITFTVDGKNASDQPYGTYENNSGADGEYGNFVTDEDWPEKDFNSRFRKVPTGTGTWVLDGETVTITDGQGAEFILTLEVKTDTTISLASGLDYYSELFSWDNTNYNYEETAHMSNKMWYNLSK